MNRTVNCPACGAKGVAAAAVADLHARGGARREPMGDCGECGWVPYPRADRRKWRGAEDLPRPRGMGAEEFAFRATLFSLWKAHPASEFVSQLAYFADWLADRGSAEESAARADWRPYAAKAADPKGWWHWTVPVGEGWASLEDQRQRHWVTAEGPAADGEPRFRGHVRIEYGRAKLARPMHNGRWLLGWPPGFVRVTAPLYHDATRWRVTVLAGRVIGATNSRPVEKVWPGGYTTLLRPHAGRAEVRENVPLTGRAEDLGLFAECGE